MLAEPQNVPGSQALSDQGMLAEILAGRFLLIHHNTILFPGWFAHYDWISRHGSALMRMLGIKKKSDMDGAVEPFINTFGAAHFSNLFRATKQVKTEQEQVACFGDAVRERQGPIEIWTPSHEQINKHEYINGVLMPIWKTLRSRFQEQVRLTKQSIITAVGHCNVPPGLGKALQVLTELECTTRQETDSAETTRNSWPAQSSWKGHTKPEPWVRAARTSNQWGGW